MSSFSLRSIPAVDYVVVGHICQDVTPGGLQFGGSALYSALTARAHGMRVGLLTSFNGDLPRQLEEGFHVINIPTEINTIFENTYHSASRKQRVISTATILSLEHIPSVWRRAPIIHLAPIANEIGIDSLNECKPEILAATPQGWFRDWDETGNVKFFNRFDQYRPIFEKAMCVFSDEDLAHDEELIENFSRLCRMLVITEGKYGSRVYWNGDVRRFSAKSIDEIDSTGAGDIFATAFFCRLLVTRDPWEASRYANEVASYSVTRRGLASIPTGEEIRLSEVEILH